MSNLLDNPEFLANLTNFTLKSQIDALKICLTDLQKEQYNNHVKNSIQTFWKNQTNLNPPDISSISYLFEKMLL